MSIDYLALAATAYAYALDNYGKKGARYDVIVECMTIDEIAAELESEGANTEVRARKWADRRAGLAHEVELNQAWDGPESCIGSERYDPKADPGYFNESRDAFRAVLADPDGWDEYDRQRQDFFDVRDGL